MSDGTEKERSCRYCGLLDPDANVRLPYTEWVNGFRNSTCQICQILEQALRRLLPDFLQKIYAPSADKLPADHICLSISGNSRIIIGFENHGWGRREADIQLYYPLDFLEDENIQPAKIPHLGTAGDISATPGTPQMWNFVRKCLNMCVQTHPKCTAAQDTKWYPERLLFISPKGAEQDVVRLIETENHQMDSPYITLSHCWGPDTPFRTTRGILPQLLSKVPVSELPRTFQDCIATARELGVYYLWIDSLCIIQDDRNDWARHAQGMDKIFENAFFTVAAVSSEKGMVPFLGPEAPSTRGDWQSVNIDLTALRSDSQSAVEPFHKGSLKARRSHPLLFPNFIVGPLEERGWTWQERYLSARIISFTEEEVRWQCKSAITCECTGVAQDYEGDLYVVTEPVEGEHIDDTLKKRWRNIVNDYSRRTLTYHTDRLPALAGVAARFRRALESDYLAGTWMTDFPRGLAWYRSELNACPTGKPEMWRSLDNKVPSWSWASNQGETNWIWQYDFDPEINDRSREDLRVESKIELVSASCIPSTSNAFGEVEPGSHLRIRGKVTEAEMESDIHSCACVRRQGFKPQLVIPDCHIVPTSVSPDHLGDLKSRREESNAAGTYEDLRRALPTDHLAEDLSTGGRSKGRVSCLLLFTMTSKGSRHACILILGKMTDGDGHYQRLGIACSDSGRSGPLYRQRKDWDIWKGWEELEEWQEWERWFSEAEERTLTIV